LKSLEISPSVSIIEPFTFAGCNSLVSIDIPPSVKIICRQAFNGCESLEYIEIPSPRIAIQNFAFVNCIALKDIVIHSPKDSRDCTIDSDAFIRTSGVPWSTKLPVTIHCEYDSYAADYAKENNFNYEYITKSRVNRFRKKQLKLKKKIQREYLK
jgi:hypothetical protein